MSEHTILNRELNINEIFQETFRVVSRGWKTIILPSILLLFVLYTINNYANFSMQENLQSTVRNLETAGQANPDPSQLFSNLIALYSELFKMLIIVLPVTLLFYLLAEIYIAHMTKGYAVDAPLTPSSAFAKIWPAFFPALIFGSIVGILTSMGFFFCLAPGVVLSVYFSFTIPHIALGGARSTNSISDPFKFLTNRFGKTFVIFFVFTIIYMIIFLSILLLNYQILGINPMSTAYQTDILTMSNPRVWILQGIMSVIMGVFFSIFRITNMVMYINYTRDFNDQSLESKGAAAIQ